MKKEYRLTKEGVAELEEELGLLDSKKPEIAEKIKAAREQGDLSENAEYAAAKDELQRTEARISEIEHILRNVEIIKGTNHPTSVRIGTRVELKTDQSTKIDYHIVGSVEADPLEQKISDESPIGRSLMGKRVGDSVQVSTPSGIQKYKIVSIS